MKKVNNNLKVITYSALITAIMCVLIPMKLQLVGLVPITITVFVLSLFSMLFNPKYALISVFIYWTLIVIGFPVAVGYQGGLARFLSPWSGYLWFYPIFSISEIIFSKYMKESLTKTILAQTLALILLYVGGIIGLMFTKYSFSEAIKFGVAPFILIDAIKITIAILIAKILKRSSLIFRK